MSHITLYDYQEELISRIIPRLVAGERTLAVMPTGAGKTATFSKLLADYLPDIGVTSACVIINREKLIMQISQTLCRVGVYHSVLAPRKTLLKVAMANIALGYSDYLIADSNITILSVQSWKSHIEVISNAALLIIDECAHVTPENVWGKVINKAGKHLLLGFTATPIRADKKELENSFDTLVQGITLPELIEKGRLVPLKVYTLPSSIDFSKLRIGTDGDYTSKSIEEQGQVTVIGADAIKVYNTRCKGLKVIAFCNSVQSCNQMADMFIAAGIPASVLHSGLSDAQFDANESAFRRGEIKVVFNVAIFSEGYDAPEIDAVFMMTPTKSLSKFHQCIGRALRAYPGKSVAYLFDFAGITQCSHNPTGLPLPTTKTLWSLKEHDFKGVKKLTLDVNCTSCLALIPSTANVCPHCNAVQEGLRNERGTTHHALYMVDGELVEVTDDANKLAIAALDKRRVPLKGAPVKLPEYVRRKIMADNAKLVRTLDVLKEIINNLEKACIPLDVVVQYTQRTLMDIVQLKYTDLQKAIVQLNEGLSLANNFEQPSE